MLNAFSMPKIMFFVSIFISVFKRAQRVNLEYYYYMTTFPQKLGKIFTPHFSHPLFSFPP